MTRSVDLERRAALLDDIVDYVLAHGISDLSLRPLADAVESSPRVLLYYWGSKEGLVQAIIETVRARQLVEFAAVRDAKYTSTSDACVAVWKMLADPRHEALYRLFFELYGLALQNRATYEAFLIHAIDDWVRFFAQPLLANGVEPDEARAFGTMLLGGFRGFLMDYCATGDRKRIERALMLWLGAIELLVAAKGKQRV